MRQAKHVPARSFWWGEASPPSRFPPFPRAPLSLPSRFAGDGSPHPKPFRTFFPPFSPPSEFCRAVAGSPSFPRQGGNRPGMELYLRGRGGVKWER